MNIPEDLATPVATVLAALIAGLVSFLVSVFTKEAKISEFRQAWIDGLRADVSEFIAAHHYIASDLTLAQGEITDDSQQLKYFREIKDVVLKIEEMQARIELRLNPEEHHAIIDQIRTLVRVDGLLLADHPARNAAIETLIADVQAVLKTEWKRVKAGERIYRATKWISLVVAALALLAGLGLLIGYGRGNAPEQVDREAKTPAASVTNAPGARTPLRAAPPH
jgi:hypothetical protein